MLFLGAQRFATEAADISKDAISRAALLDQARQQTTQLMGEERARFAAMEAELTNLKRLVQEADTENALGMRPDVCAPSPHLSMPLDLLMPEIHPALKTRGAHIARTCPKNERND